MKHILILALSLSLWVQALNAQAQQTFDWEDQTPNNQALCDLTTNYVMNNLNQVQFQGKLTRGGAMYNPPPSETIPDGFVLFRNRFIQTYNGPEIVIENCWLDYSVDVSYPGDFENEDGNMERSLVDVVFDVADMRASLTGYDHWFLIGAVAYFYDEPSDTFLYSAQAIPHVFRAYIDQAPERTSTPMLYNVQDIVAFDTFNTLYGLNLNYQGDPIPVPEPNLFKPWEWVKYEDLKTIYKMAIDKLNIKFKRE